jgi:probable F420-dependent oxidoreductase
MKIDGALFDLANAGCDAATYERQGFDGVLSFEGQHDPFVPLVLAARETERVELITAIAIALARNPMVTAYVANDLQLVSRGRFILGLGSQMRPHIEKRFGETWSRPNAQMREFVRALRAIFAAWNGGERLQFRGEFHTHTLMTPFFNPGPNPFGPPRVFLAGFGPGMVTVAGEVADGWIVHPLHSPSYVREVALPSLERGLALAGRPRSTFEIAAQTITMIGGSDEEIARARDKARAQIAFYGSTPAYKVMLDHHGWGDLQPELNRLSKEGRWAEMAARVTDEMLDIVGVSGTPYEAGMKLRARNSFAERTNLVLYNETEPEAVVDLVSAARPSSG